MNAQVVQILGIYDGEWKGESRVLPPVVSLTLLGAGDPGEQERIDFPQKSHVPLVTPGIPPTPTPRKGVDFFEEIRRLYRLRIRRDRTA